MKAVPDLPEKDNEPKAILQQLRVVSVKYPNQDPELYFVVGDPLRALRDRWERTGHLQILPPVSDPDEPKQASRVLRKQPMEITLVISSMESFAISTHTQSVEVIDNT